MGVVTRSQAKWCLQGLGFFSLCLQDAFTSSYLFLRTATKAACTLLPCLRGRLCRSSPRSTSAWLPTLSKPIKQGQMELAQNTAYGGLPKMQHSREQQDPSLAGEAAAALQSVCCERGNGHHKSILARQGFGAIAASEGLAAMLPWCSLMTTDTWGAGVQPAKITRVVRCFLSAGSLMSQHQAGQALQEPHKEGGKATALGFVNLPPDLPKSSA